MRWPDALRFDQHPVLAQGLALSPLLIASGAPASALAMLILFPLVVLVCSLLQSLLRHVYPAHQRLLVQLLLTSTVTALLYRLLQAVSLPVAEASALCLPLLAMNSLLLLHLETQARRQHWRQALRAALIPALAFVMVLIPLSALRWLLGTDIAAMGTSLLPLAQHPAGALLLLGALMAVWQQLVTPQLPTTTEHGDESGQATTDL